MKSITRFTKNIHGNQCLNCQKEIALEDNFCPECGQVNDTKRLSIKQYFSVYFEDFFNFDNRFIKTVVPLLLKPGFVTKDYIAGRRMHYVNPFQLYLHITILFFLMVGIFNTIDSFKPGSHGDSNILDELNKEENIQLVDSIKKETLSEIQKTDTGLDSATIAAISKGINNIPADIKALDSSSAYTSAKNELIRFVDSIFSDSSKVKLLYDPKASTGEKDSLATELMKLIDERSTNFISPDKELVINDSNWSEFGEEWSNLSQKNNLNAVAAEQIESKLAEQGSSYKIPDRLINPENFDLPKNALGRIFKKVKIFMDYDKEHPDINVLKALEDLGVEQTYWNVFYYDKAKDVNEAWSSSEFREELVDRFLSRISVALFFLLPIFTLIVSLLYIRRKYNYTENLVFVFHVQTVFFLLLMIFMIIGRIIGRDWFDWIFLSLFLFYLYKAMRNFYEQGRFKTIVKFILLNTFFLVLATIGAVIISFLAFLT